MIKYHLSGSWLIHHLWHKHQQKHIQSVRSLIKIRWYPNCVLIGPWTTPTSSLNTTWSNSFTMAPGPKSPRLPPVLEEGHWEYLPAASANLTGELFISAFKSSSLFSASAPPYVSERIPRNEKLLIVGEFLSRRKPFLPRTLNSLTFIRIWLALALVLNRFNIFEKLSKTFMERTPWLLVTEAGTNGLLTKEEPVAGFSTNALVL